MGFFVALQFLTTIPPILRRPINEEELGRSQGYFPLVGAFIGAILVFLDWLLSRFLPLAVVNVFLLVALVAISGALHWDGLIDTCDGVFGHKDVEQRLRVMRDSRVGSFGLLGAILLLLLKYASLNVLPVGLRWGGLVTMPILGRWAMVYAAAAFPYGRGEGMGKVFRKGAGVGPLLLATATAAPGSFLLLQWHGLAVSVAVWGLTWLMGRYLMTKLPGLTGDTYGAIGEVVEVMVLLLVIASGNL